MAVHDVGTQVLGTDVRWIGLTKHLTEPKRPVPDPLLDPELADSQVAHSADPAPAADTDGRRGVEQERKGDLDAEVPGDGLRAQALARPVDGPA